MASAPPRGSPRSRSPCSPAATASPHGDASALPFLLVYGDLAGYAIIAMLGALAVAYAVWARLWRIRRSIRRRVATLPEPTSPGRFRNGQAVAIADTLAARGSFDRSKMALPPRPSPRTARTSLGRRKMCARASEPPP